MVLYEDSQETSPLNLVFAPQPDALPLLSSSWAECPFCFYCRAGTQWCVTSASKVSSFIYLLSLPVVCTYVVVDYMILFLCSPDKCVLCNWSCVASAKVGRVISALSRLALQQFLQVALRPPRTILIDSIPSISNCRAILQYGAITARMAPESIRKFFSALPLRKKSE